MTPVHFFELASQHNRWLTARQTVVAQNVANVSTPDFKTRDVTPFSETLEATRLDMLKTQQSHFSLGADAVGEPAVDVEASKDTLHSGNNVVLENEFAKSGEISRSFALNTSVMKSFHRMFMLSTKG